MDHITQNAVSEIAQAACALLCWAHSHVSILPAVFCRVVRGLAAHSGRARRHEAEEPLDKDAGQRPRPP
eukprot:scaffold101695_cov38-Prasinocladus_malaysianus.AAC.1